MNAKSGENIGRPYWNYRVIDHGTWLGIHEVYYDEQGTPTAYTPDAAAIIVDVGEGSDAMRAALAQMHGALERPVLKPEDFPS